MLKGILHAHSNYSYDGHNSIKDIVDWAVTEGLDFVVLTEHDNDFDEHKYSDYVRECKRYREKILVLPGIEYSFGEKREIHTNIIGINRFILSKNTDDLSAFLDEVHSLGGLAILNHPLNIIKLLTIDVLNKFDCYEIWNTKSDYNYSPDLKNISTFISSKNIWKAIATSDIHRFPLNDYVTLCINNPATSCSIDVITKSLKRGEFFSSYRDWIILSNGSLVFPHFVAKMFPFLSVIHRYIYNRLKALSRTIGYKPSTNLVNALKLKS